MSRWIPLFLVLALVPGCERRVTLDVDVASFLDPGVLSGPYQTPAGAPDFSVDLPPQFIRIDGFDELRDAESLALDIEVQYDNKNGRGTTALTLYFGDDEGTLFATTPVAVIEADLSPDTLSRGMAHIEADARLLDLFRQRQLWMGARMHWLPQGDTALLGSYAISRIEARVVARIGLF